MSVQTISIDGIDYVRKDAIDETAINTDGLTYAIVRGDRSGVFAGYMDLQDHYGTTAVTLNKCRRLWYWAGAASLSQLAVDGTSKPTECKFTVETNEHKILDTLEIIPVTTKARDSIASVEDWTA